MARSEERAAENELIFRRANEHIDRRRRELDLDGRTPYLCECEEERCTTTVRLTLDEYRRIRSGPRRFLIADGHSYREATVVENGSGYVIIEKAGVEGEIAEQDAGSDGN